MNNNNNNSTSPTPNTHLLFLFIFTPSSYPLLISPLFLHILSLVPLFLFMFRKCCIFHHLLLPLIFLSTFSFSPSSSSLRFPSSILFSDLSPPSLHLSSALSTTLFFFLLSSCFSFSFQLHLLLIFISSHFLYFYLPSFIPLLSITSSPHIPSFL